MQHRTRWYAMWISAIIGVFLVDRGTKWWALNELDHAIPLVRGWLEIEYLNNPHVLFAFAPSAMAATAVLAGVLLLVLILTSREYVQGHHRHVAALLFVCAGALSNIIDRVTTGGVVDFISVPWWSVFNVADIMIVGGVAALLWWSLQRPSLAK